MKWSLEQRVSRKAQRKKQKEQRWLKPHLWFAWYPVHFGRSHNYVWLETVYRHREWIPPCHSGGKYLAGIWTTWKYTERSAQPQRRI